MNFEFCMVYITTKDREEAEKIGKKLVELRLAACSNVVEDIGSFYHWKNTIENDSESLLLLKSRVEYFQEIVSEVKKLHSYDVPCVLAYPILDGNIGYLDWLRKETKR